MYLVWYPICWMHGTIWLRRLRYTTINVFPINVILLADVSRTADSITNRMKPHDRRTTALLRSPKTRTELARPGDEDGLDTDTKVGRSHLIHRRHLQHLRKGLYDRRWSKSCARNKDAGLPSAKAGIRSLAGNKAQCRVADTARRPLATDQQKCARSGRH